MAVATLLDIRNDVKARLNEAQNTPSGRLTNGTDGTVVLATDTTLNQYINEACAEIARTCYPIRGKAVYASFPAGNTAVYFTDTSFTTTGGSRLWAVDRVIYNGLPLARMGNSEFGLDYPTYETDSNATPLYYVPVGGVGISLVPKPTSGSLTLTLGGLCIPALLSGDTDTVAWIEPDLWRLISYWSAKMIALKNLEDANLAPRAPIWDFQYERVIDTLQARLLREDPGTARAHYPMIGMMAVAGKK